MPALSSSEAFLEEVYAALDLTEGLLLTPAAEPTSDTLSVWQALGDWLTLAERMKADRLFFVGTDPVLVFSAIPDDADEYAIIQAYRQAWSLSRPQCIFIATADQLRVYDLTKPPPATVEDWQRLQPLRTLTRAAEVAEELRGFHRNDVESGQFFYGDTGIEPERRADQQLVTDIDFVAKRLRDIHLPSAIAHILIERVILVRYLEDRDIITRDYLVDIATRNPDFISNVSSDEHDWPILGAESFFVRCLRDKALTYEIFARLAAEFNGDLFVVAPEEEQQVTGEHLDLIFRLLTADANQGQSKLFLWAYDFSVVPISLISTMYEHFYHSTQDADSKGTHYTPPELVEFVLARTLTSDVLDLNPRILDPACGSGIFLVEAYKILVRHEASRTGNRLTADRLRDLLVTRIAGVDLNHDAIRLSAFSLYLAYLNYQTPQDIRSAGRPLPRLINDETDSEARPLVVSDFFCPTLSEAAGRSSGRNDYPRDSLPWDNHTFEIVVGNPPWNSPSKGPKSQAERWADERGLQYGDRSPSQLFLWRALELLRKDGTAAMLVAASVFHAVRSRKFRIQWLASVTIEEVVNFTQARHVFFSQGIAPFFLVRFRRRSDDLGTEAVEYWTVRPSISLNASKAMTYGHVDRRLVIQESLRQRDYLWKVYSWGNHHDESLMSRLDQERTLADVLRDPKLGGYGYQLGANPPGETLANLRSLRDFEPWGRSMEEWVEPSPTGVKRWPSEKLYYGRRLLIKRGVKVGFGPFIRLEEQPFSFRHTIYCIPLTDLADWQAQVVYGTLLSSLGRYRFFMTSASWAVWYDNVLANDIAQMPIRLGDRPDDLSLRVASLVEEIMRWEPKLAGPDAIHDRPSDLLQLLDSAIYRMFDLSAGEVDLVEDWRRFALGYEARGSRKLPDLEPWISSYESSSEKGQQRLPEPLARYVDVFVRKWNTELGNAGELVWDIFSDGSASPIGAVFRAVKDPVPLILATADPDRGDNTPTALELWLHTLRRLGDAMPSHMSRVISTNGIVRVVGADYFVIVKRNEQRLWSASAAYEDFEATLLAVMRSAGE